MRNLKIYIAYDGSCYHGWQRQENNITVQQVIEDTLLRILGERVTAHGCSRTDAGVHAREFCMTVRTDNPIPCPGLVRAMNGQLPDDIAVKSCEDAPEDFHARFSSKGKEYVYIINTAPVRDVFANRHALHYPHPLDVPRLDAAAKLYVGERDLAAFCRAESLAQHKTTVRTVYSAGMERSGDRVTFTVSGSGFLHHTVRIMVGTLLWINEGKISEDNISKAFATGNRELLGVTAPPDGLYLNKVLY